VLAVAGTPATTETSVRAARSSAAAGSKAAGMIATATAVKPLTVGTPATGMKPANHEFSRKLQEYHQNGEKFADV
jgi:hypothetical protein